MNTIMTYNPPKHRGTGLYHLLRGLFLALLLIAGSAKEAWGQTPTPTGTDYSGVKNIANHIWNGDNKSSSYYNYNSETPAYNWYLVPARDPQQPKNIDAYFCSTLNYSGDVAGDPATPFLTTYRTKGEDQSDIISHDDVWIVSFAATESGTDYYYIIHARTGKYIKYQLQYSGGNAVRKSVHLESVVGNTPGDAFKFQFATSGTGLNIRPKNNSENNLNPAGDNWEYYYAHSNTKSPWATGLVGHYSGTTDGSVWHTEVATLTAPTISDYDAATGKVTITERNSLPAGYNIRYTFSAEGTPADPTAASSFITNSAGNPNEITISGPGTLKVVIERYGVVLTEVSAPKTITKVVTPTFSYDGSDVTIQCATGGATIYYATSTDGGSTYGGYTAYDGTPLTGLSIGTYIRAKATKSGLINSDESEYILRPICVFGESEGNITLSCSADASEIRYTTNGKDPSGDGVTYSVYPPATPLSASGQHLIKAYAVVNDGVNTVSSAVVTLFNKPDITLSQDTYTYDGTAHEPTVTKVAITKEVTEYEAPTTPTPTYVIDSYANNTDAGTATVNLTDANLADDVYFNHCSKDFTINKADITPSVSIADWGYGDEASTPSVTGNSGEAEVTYHYKVADADDGTYTTTAPTTVGSYTIRATIAATANYNGGSATANFSVSAKSIGDGTDPASDITISITNASADAITVKQGVKTLVAGTSGTDYDYSISTTGSTSTKYYVVTITGANNYKDSFTCKFANVSFGKLAGSGVPGGAATFVSNSGDNDFATPADMTAYIITGVNTAAGTVTAEALDYIPKGVPVLLMSTVNANGFIVQPRDGGTTITTEQEAANMLKEATSAMLLTTAQYYLLYNCEFVLNAAGTLPAGRIYLDTSGGGGGGSGAPARFAIIWDSETGIEDISRFTTFKEYYSLDGRRVGGTPVKSGLYIRDGKKVVVIRK